MKPNRRKPQPISKRQVRAALAMYGITADQLQSRTVHREGLPLDSGPGQVSEHSLTSTEVSTHLHRNGQLEPICGMGEPGQTELERLDSDGHSPRRK